MADSTDPDDSEAFASDVPLTDVFGSHPKTKLIAALLTETADPVTPFTVNEISRISGVDPEMVEEHVEDLLAYGIVVETDDLDGEDTYQLDEESDAVDDIRRLYDDLSGERPASNTSE
ncbi:hypothetical protein [Halalkalicoccus sp. NIPERK01]|uniref:hypothetical protein n=1 Tax=Halalkalicoccus sp. NIPERK01 TaxID=3053469 RepID=UPI00256F3679|nr:hypothetical protein [Halalkalicoccus sp. NIPERK01]MDL5360491.1 hypothetical protein [Halalkalicoccus sp. NIPERK01]